MTTAKDIERYVREELKKLEEESGLANLKKQRRRIRNKKAVEIDEYDCGYNCGTMDVLQTIIWEFFTTEAQKKADVEQALYLHDLMYGHQD